MVPVRSLIYVQMDSIWAYIAWNQMGLRTLNSHFTPKLVASMFSYRWPHPDILSFTASWQLWCPGEIFCILRRLHWSSCWHPQPVSSLTFESPHSREVQPSRPSWLTLESPSSSSRPWRLSDNQLTLYTQIGAIFSWEIYRLLKVEMIPFLKIQQDITLVIGAELILEVQGPLRVIIGLYLLLLL